MRVLTNALDGGSVIFDTPIKMGPSISHAHEVRDRINMEVQCLTNDENFIGIKIKMKLFSKRLASQ